MNSKKIKSEIKEICLLDIIENKLPESERSVKNILNAISPLFNDIYGDKWYPLK